jgi:hypothetical protein
MGCCCCCCKRSAEYRVLPEARDDAEEYAEFQRLLAEGVEPGNSGGWIVKKDWPGTYKNDFQMRVSLRPHPSKNTNMILRGDGKYRGVKPEDFLKYLMNPDNLPGLLENKHVEDLPGGGCIKYLKVKAPGMAPRDHVWRYVVHDRLEEDGTLFVCIKTTTHKDFPETKGVIRAYYHNSSLFRMSETEPGVCEMTEFVFQDLKGSLPVCLMNAALPSGTIRANDIEMKHFKETGVWKKNQ